MFLTSVSSLLNYNFLYRDCLAETIKASEDPEVRCPHNDGFPCPAIITGQEIEQVGDSFYASISLPFSYALIS